MVLAEAATDVAVVRDALAEIEQHRARRIRGVHALVSFLDFLAAHWRPVASPPLRIVRFIALHPPDDQRIVAVGKAERVLFANYMHPCLRQRVELLLFWPFPQ